MSSFETIGPTTITTNVSVIKISPDGDFIAIGGTRNNVEIHERVDNVWVKLYDFDCPEGMEDSAVIDIIWHPWLRHDLIIAEENGVLHVASFRDQDGPNYGLVKSLNVIDVSPIYDAADWQCAVLNDDATELTGSSGNDIHTYREPFSVVHDDLPFSVYTPLPKRFAAEEDEEQVVNLWYLNTSHIVVVYPLGIASVSTVSKELIWDIPVHAGRSIFSAAISPAKDVIVAINVHREAEIYSLDNQSYVRKVETSVGLFRPVKSAIFYTDNCLALAYAEEVGFKIIPNLNALHSYDLLLARSKGRHFPPASSLIVYDSALMCGVGKIIVGKPGHGGPLTNIILVTPRLEANISDTDTDESESTPAIQISKWISLTPPMIIVSFMGLIAALVIRRNTVPAPPDTTSVASAFSPTFIRRLVRNFV
ncbi:hypothetical protein HYPSUDRAFT_204631 [Hypholoma sublateritium FD-334 SS-4]|uniref:Anaphase-promoting complex subunit 4 WD40 domain-containing protein n=1 Tax=Hypholoma sublateritium (strain FD-334 SS-4) TaxID=945553 RepID=A0A0D2KY09_HYPSF|nr:hypothetical protein HYPSUDRAFT_204631 [Hypholoma sublateritium FD-334 SS-4]